MVNSIDKQNDNVAYNDQLHKYWDKEDNESYISVTTLIHNYVNEFDSNFWTSYKALEELYPDIFQTLKSSLLATKKFDNKLLSKLNIDQDLFNIKKQEILESYDKKRDESCERGTKIHAEFENQYYKKSEHDLKKFGLGGKFTCKPQYYKLDLEKGIYPEFLISRKSSDGLLRVAGQIDLLIKDNNDIWLYDYKTNAKIDRKSFYDKSLRSSVRMKSPINHLDDCNYIHYTLQLSLYAYLLQQINPEFNIKGLTLIHIDHEDHREEIKVEYLKQDIENLLKHYKRKVKINKELDRDKPISF